MTRGSVYSLDDIKTGFERLDTNHDGFLSYAEMRKILMKGNPDFTEKQLRLLWRCVDKDTDGNVEFEEFLDFIYGRPVKKRKEVWQDTFYAFSGSDEVLAEDEFLALCACSSLTSGSFTEEDARAIFAKVKRPDDTVDATGFSKAMTRIAKKRGVKKSKVTKAVLACTGPRRRWTDYEE
uniref:EF-hand domain-containing protein n=1 Tax=Alexandrium catenella TaxID=2925 RepID=A0A7S1MBQ7_ALECA|mmetsp:Transcript_23587/g.64190  ORF Transcript_23587/g.64190 Transcript_23587/m.64190 type:complete len:179 (+) Transcript_23587:71-607(+)